MRALLPAALLLALALAGCTGNAPTGTVAPTQPLDQGNAPATGTTPPPTATTGPTTGSSGAQTHTVSIASFKFTPDALTVKAGDSVTWTNQDGTDHTVTATGGGAFDSGALHQGGTFTHTFASAGTYTYHCSIHTSMTGTVTVQ